MRAFFLLPSPMLFCFDEKMDSFFKATTHSAKIKQLAVLTSGGDAPGMNSAIRAVTRTALQKGLTVFGVQSGYHGLYHKKWTQLTARSMANIIQRGGTLLKTARFTDFLKAEVRAVAANNMKDLGLDALVCIGGDGSFRGAHALWAEHQIPVVGIPGTIDNDIYGTEKTLGFDTAVNTAMEAIDKIRDTAESHDRVFIVEVMGRNSGHIAAQVGLAGGAEDVIVPEDFTPLDQIIKKILDSKNKGKLSSILVTAEGQKPGRAYDLAEQLRKRANIDAKVVILGHIQRGGTPTATDRNLGSMMGNAAVEALLTGETDLMIGVRAGHIVKTHLHESYTLKQEPPTPLVQLTRTLSF
jgi:6-phosphofructokinase 1